MSPIRPDGPDIRHGAAFHAQTSNRRPTGAQSNRRRPMKIQMKIAMVLGALALAVAPAMALADQPADPGSQGKGPHYEPAPPTPGPKASLPEKAKAYGVHCRGESKKHVKGEKGTAFSRCVTAMAKAATNDDLTAREA